MSSKMEEGVFERAEKARDAETRVATPTWTDVARPSLTVGAMDASEFDDRLAQLSTQREFLPPGDHQKPLPPPIAVSQQQQQMPMPMQMQVPDRVVVEDAFPEEERRRPSPSSSGLLAIKESSRDGTILPPPKLTHTVVRYLAVNGADRDLSSDPYRFQFTFRTGGRQRSQSLQKSYTNIAWIESTRIILPMEVVQATGSVVMPKGFYNLAYSFAYPYVMLMIDGFDDIYDGSNDTMRRTFCTFIYDNEYKGPNGRGYLMLRPAQNERKTYPQAPLGVLPNLKLSIVKPNGTLFNNSRDGYTVSDFVYEPQNRLFIKVVVDQYWDRNEYWVGDMINLSGLEVRVVSPSASAAPYVSALQTYLTRHEGFEIVQLGTSNPQGFYNSFYVLAPGVLDQTHGQVIVDQNLLGVVSSLVDGTVAISKPAQLLNASLQPVVTMRVGCLSGNAPASQPIAS